MTSSFLGTILDADRSNWPDHENYTFQALSGVRVAGQINDASHFRSGDNQASGVCFRQPSSPMLGSTIGIS